MGEWFLHPFSMQITHLFPITGPAKKYVENRIIFSLFGGNIYFEHPMKTCTPLEIQLKDNFKK